MKKNIKINNSIYHGLKGTDLSVNLDLLTSDDIETFGPTLANCMFTSVKLMGNPFKATR